MKMTSRERVLAAINHTEADRVPVDLGGTILSGISAKALTEFKKYKGLNSRPVKIIDLLQILSEMEEELIELLKVDTLSIEPQKVTFGIEHRSYKPWSLYDGTEVLMPGSFEVEEKSNGDWILHEEGKNGLPAVARMPKDGFFFDVLDDQRFNMEYEPPPVSELIREHLDKQPGQFVLDTLSARAEKLRPSEKAIILGVWPYIGPPSVGSIPDWLCLMLMQPEYVDELFRRKTEADLKVLEGLHRNLGDNVDILGIDGVDFGTQRAGMFSTELFERYYYPYYLSINDWVHSNTNWKTWKHSCGSIEQFLPFLVKSGLDCINPVQCSAAGMKPGYLKDKYGDSITFWGGGADTQWTLPFGTPDEVYTEVKKRLEIFKPGGGYVFNPVHNILPETPPQNIDAMFEAVKDFGKY